MTDAWEVLIRNTSDYELSRLIDMVWIASLSEVERKKVEELCKKEYENRKAISSNEKPSERQPRIKEDG